MSYYHVPDHTHIADVSLQRSDRGYAVTAAFVTLPERAIDEPYTDTRTWHVESSNLWRDLGSAGWAMDHYDRLVDGHRIHAEPSVGSTLALPEISPWPRTGHRPAPRTLNARPTTTSSSSVPSCASTPTPTPRTPTPPCNWPATST